MSYYPGQSKTSRRITYTIMFLIGTGLTVGLYYVKTRAQSSKSEVARLERLLQAENAALNVLKAEIAYLESPKRVSGLARGELGLVPVKTGGVIELHEIAKHFPLAADQSAEVSLP
ncbi:MAG: cell division protein FtsL [Alphaproteobacteria bacterium]